MPAEKRARRYTLMVGDRCKIRRAWHSRDLAGGRKLTRPTEATLDDFVFIIRAEDLLTEVSGMLPYSRMSEFPYAICASDGT
jgi:hypothetical protein